MKRNNRSTQTVFLLLAILSINVLPSCSQYQYGANAVQGFAFISEQRSDKNGKKLPKAAFDTYIFDFDQKIQAKLRPKLAKKTPHPLEKLSNKALYFVILHYNYQKLSDYIQVKRPLTSCPQLHNTFLDLKSQQERFNREKAMSASTFDLDHYPLDRVDMSNSNWGSYFPEWQLQANPGKSDSKSLWQTEDLVQLPAAEKKAQLYKAIKNSVEGLYQELVELCEDGSTDFYFSYENFLEQQKSLMIEAANVTANSDATDSASRDLSSQNDPSSNSSSSSSSGINQGLTNQKTLSALGKMPIFQFTLVVYSLFSLHLPGHPQLNPGMSQLLGLTEKGVAKLHSESHSGLHSELNLDNVLTGLTERLKVPWGKAYFSHLNQARGVRASTLNTFSLWTP